MNMSTAHNHIISGFMSEFLYCLLFAFIGLFLGWLIELMFRKEGGILSQEVEFYAFFWFLLQLMVCAAVLAAIQCIASVYAPALLHPSVKTIFFISFFFGTQLTMFVRLNRLLYSWLQCPAC